MATGMRWVKLPAVLLAVVSVLASAQCVARCAVEPCHQAGGASSSADLPPCHRHHPPEPAPRPCASPVFVTDGRTIVSPITPPVQTGTTFLAVTPNIQAVLAAQPADSANPAASPPETGNSTSLLVLRI